MKFFYCFLVAIAAHFFSVEAITIGQRVEERVKDLETIKNIYENAYAPMEWKGLYYNYSFNEAFERAKAEVISNPDLSVREFHRVVKRLCGSLNDYHVQAIFDSTELSLLPFDVIPAEGRYFIYWLDSSKFPHASFAPAVGDEILEIDGEPVSLIVSRLKEEEGRNANRATDLSMAARDLTIRIGQKGDLTPVGSVNVKIKSAKKGTVALFNLKWHYFPETFTHPHDFFESWFPFLPASNKNLKQECDSFPFKMIYPSCAFADREGSFIRSKRGRFSSQKGFLPLLGKPVWEYKRVSKSKKEEPADLPYHAYIYGHPKGYQIGYIRIPSFNREDSEEFGTIIATMEKKSDLLVIDQLDNPGGDVDYMFDLFSYLAKSDLVLLKDTFKLNYGLIRNCKTDKKYSEGILESIADYEKANKKNSQGTKAQLEEKKKELKKVAEIKAKLIKKIHFYDELIAEWDAGKIITKPLYLSGIKSIAPNPVAHYTKPIIVLINELDISCADYFPAVMQDNGRALLFGTRTAGAGGNVDFIQLNHSRTGIMLLGCTTTVGNRKNLAVLEDLGVEPDVRYSLTAEDIQGSYKGYIRKLNETIESILGKKR